MYSHIQYEYGQQYHADLLRQAAQSRLAHSTGKAENGSLSSLLTQAWSALVHLSSILAKSRASARQFQNSELSCQIC